MDFGNICNANAHSNVTFSLPPLFSSNFASIFSERSFLFHNEWGIWIVRNAY